MTRLASRVTARIGEAYRVDVRTTASSLSVRVEGARLVMPFQWTDESYEIATKLWRDGVSAAAIGREIGCSRNAVIGKMHRNGHQKQTTQSAQKRVKPPRRDAVVHRITTRLRTSISAIAVDDRPLREAVVLSSNPKTLFELEAADCRWPLGHPGDPNFRFCGAPQCAGLSYCAGHARLAYVPAARRKGGTDGEAFYKPKTNGFDEAITV